MIFLPIGADVQIKVWPYALVPEEMVRLIRRWNSGKQKGHTVNRKIS